MTWGKTHSGVRVNLEAVAIYWAAPTPPPLRDSDRAASGLDLFDIYLCVPGTDPFGGSGAEHVRLERSLTPVGRDRVLDWLDRELIGTRAETVPSYLTAPPHTTGIVGPPDDMQYAGFRIRPVKFPDGIRAIGWSLHDKSVVLRTDEYEAPRAEERAIQELKERIDNWIREQSDGPVESAAASAPAA